MYVMNFVFTVNEIDELLEIFHALKSKCIYGQTAFERTHFKRTITKFELTTNFSYCHLLILTEKFYFYLCFDFIGHMSAYHSPINSLAFYLNQLSVEPYCN